MLPHTSITQRFSGKYSVSNSCYLLVTFQIKTLHQKHMIGLLKMKSVAVPLITLSDVSES